MAENYAGILLFRRTPHLQMLLAHPGGPAEQADDDGTWLIPAGEVASNQKLLSTAKKAFADMLGFVPEGTYMQLGSGEKEDKSLHVWAVEFQISDDFIFDPDYFEIEWPPESGQTEAFPVIDKIEYFSPFKARNKLIPSQRPFISRLIHKCSQD